MTRTIWIALLGSGLIACQPAKELAKGREGRSLYRAVASNPVFSNHHTGFALYDPVEKQWLCQFNAGKYYTPASNTKILTLLTALNVLGDSIESFRYAVQNDSLFFRGMADPGFLFSHVPTSQKPFQLLKTASALCYLADVPIKALGPGWAWDDYPFAYQVERSTFPVYGNRVLITKDADRVRCVPQYFSDYLQADIELDKAATRDPFANAFYYSPVHLDDGDTIAIPFILSDFDFARILADTLHKPVHVLYDRDVGALDRVVYGASRDTLLKRMMQVSDNFIAEQLLMQCAFYMRGVFESDSAIAVSKQMIMGGVPDPLNWVDGSGLSRYNLCTPRSIVWVLDQIRQLTSMDYITEVFPAGGETGTIRNHYRGDPPFVFAKTGTLRNQHCLSGFIRTDGGRWLIFSFMHNNFAGSSSAVKQEMERILLQIRSAY